MVQTQGRKRWRVYAPPPPKLKKESNPLARGKGMDVLDPETLGPPLVDTIMKPGQIMYVPSGFPHATSTAHTGEEGEEGLVEEPSVHLTLGVDTHLWGLSFLRMREAALERKKKSPLFEGRLIPTALDVEAYFRLQSPLPLGFLAAPHVAESADPAEALAKHMAADLARRMVDVEPERWQEYAEEPLGLAELLDLESVAKRFVQHHQQVMTGCYSLCQGAALGATLPSNAAPLERARPLMAIMDAAMDSLALYQKPDAAGGTPVASVPANLRDQTASATKGKGRPGAKKGKRASASRGFG